MEPINDAAWGDNGDRKAPREGPSTIKRKKRLAERENQPPPPVAPAKDKASTSRVSTGKLDLKRIIFKYTISQRKQSTVTSRPMQRPLLHIIRKVDQYHHLTPKVTFLRVNKVLMTTTNLRGLLHSPICPALSRGLPVAHRTKSLSLIKQRRLWKRHRRTTSSSSF